MMEAHKIQTNYNKTTSYWCNIYCSYVYNASQNTSN